MALVTAADPVSASRNGRRAAERALSVRAVVRWLPRSGTGTNGKSAVLRQRRRSSLQTGA